MRTLTTLPHAPSILQELLPWKKRPMQSMPHTQPAQLGLCSCPCPKSMRIRMRLGGSEFERARSDTTGARSTDGHVLFRSVETRACEPDHGADHQGAMIRLTRIRIIHSHSHFDALDSCLDERTMVSRRRTHLSRPSGPSQDLI